MPQANEPTEPKDTRISVPVADDPKLAKNIDKLADMLRVPKGTVGFLALKFVVPRVISGEMRVVNGELEFVEQKAA